MFKIKYSCLYWYPISIIMFNILNSEYIFV